MALCSVARLRPVAGGEGGSHEHQGIASSRPRGARRFPRTCAFTSSAALSSTGIRIASKDEDVEARWQTYLQGDEHLAFSALATSLQNLPAASQLAEHRWDFELLVHHLHRLGVAMRVDHASKAYRSHYSPDVQLTGYLYSTLLTAFTLLPSYVLNGQDFYVSDTVLDQCRSLQAVFLETCEELKRQFNNLQPYSLDHIRTDVRRLLIYFDRSWCRFEMPALEEIEAIHRQACRPLIEAIEVERGLTECEGGSSSSSATRSVPVVPQQGGRKMRFEVQRSRFMEKINELNRLANVDGHGRSDMDLTCVLEAERIATRPMCTYLARLSDCNDPVSLQLAQASTSTVPVGNAMRRSFGAEFGAQATCRCGGVGTTGCAPPVLLKVAHTLLKSSKRVRRVLQRYARCLYQLNSHLANNSDLVRALELFEAAWETASKYLVQPGPKRVAMLAYSTIAAIREPGFQDALASLDPGVLVASVPRALLFNDMKRAAAAVCIGGRTNGVVAAADVFVGKQPSQAARMGNAVGPTLPRPALDGTQREGAAWGSALQRSPIARAFLPPDAAASYNEAVATLGCLSEAQLGKLQAWLLASPGGGNTPPSAAIGAAARGETAAAVVSAARRLPSAVRSACGSGCGQAAERPPRTPCPPRMAVPNSRPTTIHTKVEQSSLPTQETEDSDEDDAHNAFNLDLSGLQGSVEAAALSNLTSSASPDPDNRTMEGAQAAGRIRQEDCELHQVMASISTLAVRLQRAKPQEWNELIQVVLQGLILAHTSPARGPAGFKGGVT